MAVGDVDKELGIGVTTYGVLSRGLLSLDCEVDVHGSTLPIGLKRVYQEPKMDKAVQGEPVRILCGAVLQSRPSRSDVLQ